MAVARAREKEKPARPPTGVLIERIAVMMFGRYGRRLSRAFELDRVLAEAGMDVYPSIYAAKVIFYTFVAAIVAVIGIGIVALLPISLAGKLIAAILLLLLPVFVFTGGLAYPSSKKGAREKGVNSELPYFAAYMTIMARAGTAPEKIIEKIAELRVFKAIRDEARRIMRDVKIFGLDPLTAIERNAYNHPSRYYREFMLGYVTTVRTGGDVIHYLELRSQDIFQRQAEELRSIAERVGMIVEGYITLALIGTLSFYIFFIVSGIMPVGGTAMGGVGGIMLYSFVLMPLFTVTMIMAIDAAQPKTPIYHKEPYAWFILTTPIGVLAMMILIAATGAYRVILGQSTSIADISALIVSVAIGLILAAVGPAYSYSRIMKREKRLHHALAEFLRDLAEVRKTGLSPERSIIMIAERDYGTLTPIVKRLAGALATGLNLYRALREALKGYRDWFLLVNMRILADAIDVGGGSPQILDTMARFVATLASLVEELRRRLRTYAYMPYFGSILVISTSIMVILMLSQSITSVLGGGAATAGLRIKLTVNDIVMLLLATSIGSMFNSWLMGLMVGKVQTTMTASGFKHAIILTVLNMVIAIGMISSMATSLLQSPAVAGTAPP